MDRRIASFFEALADRTGSTWSIPASTVRKILDLDELEYFRTAYRVRDGISALTKERFGPDDAVFLLELFEACGIHGAEDAFTGAGLHVDYVLGAEIQDSYITFAVERARDHHPDDHHFRSLLEEASDFQTAFKRYLDVWFRRDALSTDSIEPFVRKKGFRFPDIAGITIARYIELLYMRHILEWYNLFPNLRKRFSEKFSPRQPENLPDEVELALRVLGFPVLPGSFREVRSRYKSLMKRYHPDVNPSGLEHSKRINTAFALLAAHAAGGASDG